MAKMSTTASKEEAQEQIYSMPSNKNTPEGTQQHAVRADVSMLHVCSRSTALNRAWLQTSEQPSDLFWHIALGTIQWPC
eukprot:m.13494 g.13494  ORF g.13494 m.13494 type:complete len:79 (+) comp5949_c0_seq1:1066-1302(+)